MLDRDTRPFGEEIKTGSTDSILASLFRTILMELNVTPIRFERLLERYITNARLPNNIKEASSQRGNLKKELLKSSMSWKVFVKGMVFLNVRKFDISIKLHHASGLISEHRKTIALVNFTDHETEASDDTTK
jgi:hypothetical protein